MMLEALTTPMTAVVEEPLGSGAVRLGVDVRPDRVTFVAQVQLYARPDPSPRSLDGHRGWARDFLDRVREQVQPVLQAGALGVIASLAEENARLREALADCVETCGEALSHAEADGRCEGGEGGQARAWLALDRAREVLGETAALAGP